MQSQSRDYLAEMCVAGVLADNGWNVYFPHRDVGFDMIATFSHNSEILIRPIQVKGKYPNDGKLNKPVYGFVGKLTAMHHDMALVIPYFTKDSGNFPDHIAWVPPHLIRPHSRGFSAQYAKFTDGKASPRRDFVHLFDQRGLSALSEVKE